MAKSFTFSRIPEAPLLGPLTRRCRAEVGLRWSSCSGLRVLLKAVTSLMGLLSPISACRLPGLWLRPAGFGQAWWWDNEGLKSSDVAALPRQSRGGMVSISALEKVHALGGSWGLGWQCDAWFVYRHRRPPVRTLQWPLM